MDHTFIKRFTYFLLVGFALTACGTSQQALQSIPVTPAPAAPDCQYLGRLTVIQPHGIQSGWMPSVDQQAGVMKQLRKQAHDRGANYVQILAQHATVALSPKEVDQQSKTTAIIYRCHQ